MRLFHVLLIIAMALIVTMICGYVFFLGGDTSPSTSFTDSHFTVKRITCPVCFEGENVIVQATILDDEPMRVIASPTVSAESVTDDNGDVTTTYTPTTVAQIIGGYGIHTVTAELTGGTGANIVLYNNLSLKNNQSKTLDFSFGKLPAGLYVVTVTAPSYDSSIMSATFNVNRKPLLSQWTSAGGVDFLMVNLAHDSVDVNIRNSGQRTVIFGADYYSIFINVSGGYGVELQGLNKTIVQPGQTVTVHAKIPLSGSYFLEYFAIRVPDRTALVKIPVNALLSV
jgi:hypothetical protein